MTSRSLHPSMLVLLALTLSGCGGMVGVTAIGPRLPVHAEITTRASATVQTSASAQVDANASLQVEAEAQVGPHAGAQVAAVAGGQGEVQVNGAQGGVWADDRDVIVGWQASAPPNAVPDPITVADVEVASGGEVQLASAGGAGVGASHRGAGVDAQVRRDDAANANTQGRGGVTATAGAQASDPGAANASPFIDANAGTDARAQANAQAEAQAEARIQADAEARAQAEAQAEVDARTAARARHLGGGAGVRGLHGRAAHLPALIEAGLNVDGEFTDLSELSPLWVNEDAATDMGSSVEARIDTGAELQSSVSLEHSRLPAAGGETHMVVRVRGADLPTGDGSAAARRRGHVRVRLVLDRSSSMQAAWRQVLGAARGLLAQLSADDELQIVAYGTHAVEALPTSRVGDGSRARRALADIRVGGGTNIEAGLRLAYDAGARGADDRLTLVVLVSDGVPNGGAFTADELAPMAARAKLEQGCRTTVVGFGDEFDAEALRAIAQAGGGAYRVAPGAEELGAVLESEVSAMGQVRARDVQVRVALPAGVHLSEAAGDVRLTADHELSLSVPALAAGEERSLILGLRVEAGRGSSAIARVNVSYRVGSTQRQAEKSVSVARGAARLNADAARALADADLGLALDIAARAVSNGQGQEAAAALRAHAQRVQVQGRVDVRLSARANAALRVASALERLVPGASWPERRRTSLAIGELSARFGG